MRTLSITSVFTFLFIISCGSNPETTYTAKGPGYSLQLPESMSETTNLNDEASLEYQSILKELFVIVIDESKADMQAAIDNNPDYAVYNNDLQGYYDLVTSNLKATLSREELPEPADTKINGLPAKILDVEGIVEGENIYWKFAFIEGKKNYYQAVTWTGTGHREDHEKAMEEIVTSFKETSKSKY